MKSIWGIWITVPFMIMLLPTSNRPILHGAATVHKTAKEITQYDCAEAFEQLVASEDWFEQLVNPTLTTQDQISERLDLYSKIHACIGNDPESLPYELFVIQRLTEYFLIFAGGFDTPENETVLVLTSLEQSDDKGIVRIRDKAGIPPPKGYIFVRFYSSRHVMPDLVYQAFQSENVSGATILMRYVAILSEKGTQPQEVLRRLALPETISHELVHAYINSILGLRGIDLPEWYREGIAIYFSGSGRLHTTVSGDFVIYTTPPEEYQQYDTNFKYLEAQLGRKILLERIRQSVEQADPAVLYQDLGIANYQDLAARASEWQHQRQRKALFYKIIVCVLIISSPFIVLGILPKIAEQLPTRCRNCGYRGKREEFVGSYCPKCRHKL